MARAAGPRTWLMIRAGDRAAVRALLGDASVMVMLLVSREGDRSLFRLARAAE